MDPSSSTEITTPQQQQPEEEDPLADLKAASTLADLIHKKLSEAEQQTAAAAAPTTGDPQPARSSWKIMPGLVEGLVAGSLIGVGLIPVRRLFPILKRHAILDFGYTFTHVALALQGSLLVGWVYGTRAHLHKLATTLEQEQPQTRSPTTTNNKKADPLAPMAGIAMSPRLASALCQEPTILTALETQRKQPQPQDAASSWDPQEWVVQEYHRVLQACRTHNEARLVEQQQQQQQPAQNSPSTSSQWRLW